LEDDPFHLGFDPIFPLMGPGKKKHFQGRTVSFREGIRPRYIHVTKGRPAGEPRCWSRDASGVPVTTRPRPGRGFPAKSAAGSDQGCSCGEGAVLEKVVAAKQSFVLEILFSDFWRSLPINNKFKDIKTYVTHIN